MRLGDGSDGSEQQRRDPHTSRAQRARGRCPIVHLFTSGGLYLSSLGGATLMTHAKFEVIAKLIMCTRVRVHVQQRATSLQRTHWRDRTHPSCPVGHHHQRWSEVLTERCSEVVREHKNLIGGQSAA